MKYRKREVRIFLFTLSMLVLAVVVSFCVGRYRISWSDLFGGGPEQMGRKVFYTLRLPRTIMAVCAGFVLSMAGSIYQTLFRNPLAAPDIIGVSSGAGAGAAFAIVLFGGGMWMTSVFAFAGGLLTVMLALGLVTMAGRKQMAVFVISGIAVNSLAQSIVMVLKLMADPERQLASIEYWMMGSFASITMSKLLAALPFAVTGLVGVCLLHRQVTMLALEEEEARMLGVPVALMRKLIMVLVTLMVSGIISVTGLISFIGLIAPHLARLIMKDNRFFTAVYSGIIGALLLVVSDCIARSLTTSELPVSVVTSFIGVPFLIYFICGREKIT